MYTHTAPAIRVIDEKGHEVRDRYYKIGSTIELSCQVATSYLINPSASTPDPNRLQLYYADATKSPPPVAAAAQSSPPSSPSSSLEKRTFDSKFYRKIVWLKDGEPLPSDALFNIRFVCVLEPKKKLNEFIKGHFLIHTQFNARMVGQ